MSIKNFRVKKSSADIETHEVFLDTLAKVNEERTGLFEKRFEVPLKIQMAYGVFAVFIILSCILLGRVFYFNVVNGNKFAIEAENNMGSANVILPARGIIYDKNFNKLVLNSPDFDLVCDRNYFSSSSPQNDTEISEISTALGTSYADFMGKINASNSAQVLLSENISQDNLLALEAHIGDIHGCSISQNTTRNYVAGPVFSPVLGYMGRINQNEYASSQGYSINDYIGKTGLEQEYESYLRGTAGQSNPKRTTAEIANPSDVLVPPVAGDNLVLNIDSKLQTILYNSLATKLKDIGAKRGAAVAMDPRTGAVLALVSYPSYDDNLFSQGISQTDFDQLQNNPNQPLFDRAISAHYPTGSIIKPLEASAALQEKIISPDKQINDPGYILVPSQYDPSVVYRYGGVEAHGLVDMRKAIAVSSNIYFYTVGGGYGDQQGLGPTRIKQYLSDFGWNEKTGIDLPGEFQGFIPDPAWKKATRGQSWVDGDTYNLAIGQSDLQTTPLQVADAYSAIANGGTLYQPQLVDKIISGSGSSATVVKQFTPQVTRSDFIDPANLEIVREGMRDGVTQSYGLSKSLNDLPVAVAAKTGTAQIPVANRYNLWSAAFAPYDNPQIVIVVTAEEVNALGAVTLPVAHDALSYFFSDANPNYGK